MLEHALSYADLCRRFRWVVPPEFNIAEACCDRHVDDPGRPALIDGRTGEVTSFRSLQRQANRLANTLFGLGVRAGDRIAILLDQRVETVVAHLAAYKLAAIALPLFRLFGPDALAYRLRDSGAVALISDRAGTQAVGALSDRLPELQRLITIETAGDPALAWEALLEQASDRFATAPTKADDPALLIYTSGTTGPPKGALHAHRVLLGHLPGVQMSHDLMPQPGDRFWTPADWAWIGGLLDVLMPSLYFGLAVVINRSERFDPERAADLMARHHVRNAFIPPTALRLMRQSGASPMHAGARLRSVASGGERLGDDVILWGQQAFGVTINEFYGQTECNMVVSSCGRLLATPSKAMGVAVPGHTVAVIDEAGAEVPSGHLGEIAVRRPDPVMFLNYWRNPEATAAKFCGEWLTTGDLGFRSEDGFLTMAGRADDVINVSGYRIGPAEIEACLTSHPAVAQAAVVGLPDAMRGERIKAFVVLAADQAPSEALTERLRAFVKTRLAAHEAPREFEYRSALPMTATGKIRRAALRDEAVTNG